MSVNVDYINPFIESTEELFSTMLTLGITRGKPYLKTDSAGSHYISGIIGMAGEASGSAIVSFPHDLSIEVVSDFLGETLSEIDQNVKDGIGELANIIAGGAKMETDRDILEMVKGSVEAGGAGVSIGRNAFQHHNPSSIVKAISNVVHKNATVEEALELVEKS